MSGNDVGYLDAMDEVLVMSAEFIEASRHADDDVMMGSYLKMASRCLRCALEMYGEHLEQNRSEMKHGEPVNENLPSGINPQ